MLSQEWSLPLSGSDLPNRDTPTNGKYIFADFERVGAVCRTFSSIGFAQNQECGVYMNEHCTIITVQ